ncbi:DUF4429 domain-containing protein [Enterococcus sp. DIV1314a]|uniref:DUF4429 domain-containing protein n=1 Tax=Enterococcus sp. DIV1314a TaxID=2774660 RepID=UPI003F1E88D9
MANEIIIKSPGHTVISVTPETITITRKGLLNYLNQGIKGDKTIPIRNITAVQLKKPGMTNGYIQFSVLGGNESRGGLSAATQDENTVMFANKYWDQIQSLKTFIEKTQLRMHQSPATTQTAGPTDAEQILAFKNLLDQGIITQEEFNAKKAQILGL